jgi:transcriptional regulator with XRE-family HTH domain
MKRITDHRTLTGEQFAQALAALGWKQTDFVRRTGLTTGTVSRWATGQVAVPLWVGEYLGALQELAALHARYVKSTKASKAHQVEGDGTT